MTIRKLLNNRLRTCQHPSRPPAEPMDLRRSSADRHPDHITGTRPKFKVTAANKHESAPRQPISPMPLWLPERKHLLSAQNSAHPPDGLHPCNHRLRRGFSPETPHLPSACVRKTLVTRSFNGHTLSQDAQRSLEDPTLSGCRSHDRPLPLPTVWAFCDALPKSESPLVHQLCYWTWPSHNL